MKKKGSKFSLSTTGSGREKSFISVANSAGTWKSHSPVCSPGKKSLKQLKKIYPLPALLLSLLHPIPHLCMTGITLLPPSIPFPPRQKLSIISLPSPLPLSLLHIPSLRPSLSTYITPSPLHHRHILFLRSHLLSLPFSQTLTPPWTPSLLLFLSYSHSLSDVAYYSSNASEALEFSWVK